MYKIPKQSYTTEFKQEAVRQVEIDGKSAAQVARELGIAEQTLSNWRKASKAGKLAGITGKPVTPEQMELSRLKAENSRLKMEVEILKKRRRTSRRNHCEVRLDRRPSRCLSIAIIM
jgi:transposase